MFFPVVKKVLTVAVAVAVPALTATSPAGRVLEVGALKLNRAKDPDFKPELKEPETFQQLREERDDFEGSKVIIHGLTSDESQKHNGKLGTLGVKRQHQLHGTVGLILLDNVENETEPGFLLILAVKSENFIRVDMKVFEKVQIQGLTHNDNIPFNHAYGMVLQKHFIDEVDGYVFMVRLENVIDQLTMTNKILLVKSNNFIRVKDMNLRAATEEATDLPKSIIDYWKDITTTSGAEAEEAHVRIEDTESFRQNFNEAQRDFETKLKAARENRLD